MSATYSHRNWRRIFIVSEAMVVGYFTLIEVARRFYPRVYPDPPALGLILAYSAALAWLFLLVASPFFLRSLRGIALAGLIIALVIPVIICVLSLY
jgi:hypothetical protein